MENETKLTAFERIRESLKDDASSNLGKNVYPNGQTPANILDNLDEYTVRFLSSIVKNAAINATRVSKKEIRYDQFIEMQPFTILKNAKLEERLCQYVEKTFGTYDPNVEANVRNLFFPCLGIPEKYKISTREEVEQLKKNYEELYNKKNENGNWDNYDYRLSLINAFYDYRSAEIMYEGCNPKHDSTTIRSLNEQRQEKIIKLGEELGQNIASSRPRH